MSSEVTSNLSEIAKLNDKFEYWSEHIIGLTEDIQTYLPEFREMVEQVGYEIEDIDISNIDHIIEFARIVGEFSNRMKECSAHLGADCQTLLNDAKKLKYEYEASTTK